jgi:Fic family protein
VTERADWEGWAQYFLSGLARQSKDALSRAERLNQLLENRRNELAGQAATRVALQMVDLLGGNPFLTPRVATEKLNLAYNTVMRAIGQLERLGIVINATKARRGRVFCAKALLDILEEPARLTPAEPPPTVRYPRQNKPDQG